MRAWPWREFVEARALHKKHVAEVQVHFRKYSYNLSYLQHTYLHTVSIDSMLV